MHFVVDCHFVECELELISIFYFTNVSRSEKMEGEDTNSKFNWGIQRRQDARYSKIFMTPERQDAKSRRNIDVKTQYH